MFADNITTKITQLQNEEITITKYSLSFDILMAVGHHDG